MEKLQNLSAVNTNAIEGRYLMGALAILTTEGKGTKITPDEMLDKVYDVAEAMFIEASEIPEPIKEERLSFEKELSQVINRHSIENGSNTPDFILAKYLFASLINWQDACKEREEWYGKKMSIGMD